MHPCSIEGFCHFVGQVISAADVMKPSATGLNEATLIHGLNIIFCAGSNLPSNQNHW